MWAVFYEAVRAFFAQARWAGATIPVVYASPDRAHAAIQKLIADREAGQRGVSRTEQAASDRPNPVPFMSLFIGSPKFDPRYYSPSRVVLGKDTKKLTATVARAPHPVTAEVQVDLWCGSDGGDLKAFSIEPQIEMAFHGGHVALPIDWSDAKWFRPPFNVAEHLKHYGQTRIRLYTQGWQDTSDLEAGDGAKETRRTWTGRIEAMVPFKPEEARIIHTITTDIETVDTNETIGTLTSGVED
jgi:hypothetical protein